MSTFLQMQQTSAGDTAAYQRLANSSDDVVIVSALRTPITKVQSQHQYLYNPISLEVYG